MWTSLLLASAAAFGEGCRRDASGIAWVLPYDAAVKQARERQRLLLIKPIAFGTTKDGGW